ncbi:MULTISPECIES: LysR family transcriptional regulator [unclassified Pseudomonas]|uniref:LysR family transcriptional regulator n=1 Tax=unclassified Pseudomonas TaxID=196821 RepID=UPI000BC8DADE|nr:MULTISPECIES: LysR family transcriptional regulator [unclassified Pseudomonas]PVZ20553.1 DNA-binding transcriptional LysR family regulator [Pseudomonas sp. URIL14HWK12:I12]PVZ27619.1 DNA-binding transcriptional LysR family regulator [Pseudomonas sp. URIL14HWK12:I10]PVZ38508.1 DNA-binding transcriptional LysR family regulator [Pseudomonas sp. URIL14HWK12:I11]SNZ03079.1 transcriptional regulator, LysR family [Pseudomonas sp. URIL14HWK12:I9]
MDYHGIDLNLLAAFNALMNERNVTRAATQVGVSQPAMSAALSRLRKLLGDPLFLRSPEGLLPTPRARELAEPIAQALNQIKTALVKAPAFIPADAVFTVNLGLSDYPAFVLLPRLLQTLSDHAPNLSVNVHAFNDRDHAVDMLDAGVIDAAVGVLPSHQDGRILTRPILRDAFVTLIAHSHPAARRAMDIDTYLSLTHVLASPEGERHGLVDQALAQLGKQRKLAVTLPQMFAVPAIIASSGMTATVLKRIALSSPTGGKLALFPPPVALPEITFHLIWHRRADGNPAQEWFRAMIESVASELR